MDKLGDLLYDGMPLRAWLAVKFLEINEKIELIHKEIVSLKEAVDDE